MLQRVVDERLGFWAAFALTAFILALFAEVGHRFGLRQSEAAIESKKAQASVLLAALLALLGLLLAFSFNTVEQRFSARKALVLAEANAIGTAYLRAEMLPSPHEARVEELLRAYLALRIPGRVPGPVERALERSEALHDDLWAEAVVVAKEHPASEVVSLFVRSLNEIIDLHESRVTVAYYQRLPAPILTTLVALSIVVMSVLGFNSGLARRRLAMPTVAVILVVSAVIVMIVELDRPESELFHVSQRALEDVERTMTRRAGD